MEKANSFVIYESYFKSANSLKDDKAFRELITSICMYGLYGEIIAFEYDYVEAIFQSHKTNIDYSINRRKKNIENGLKGGAPEGNQNARKQPKKTENNQSTETDNLNVDVDVDPNANEYAYVNAYVEVDADSNAYGDGKENEILKSKRKGGGEQSVLDATSLKTSELEKLFPEEDINCVDSYYTKLKGNGFMSIKKKKQIVTIEDLKKDFEDYRRSNK